MELNPASQSPISQAVSNSSAAEDDRTVISSDFETFLKMLTTQLENQDPLDPVKSEDFAVQLATFSGVEQQVLTNDLLEALLSQSGLSGITQYAGWVGMEARAPVSGYFDGSPVGVSTSADPSADSAQLVVKNAFGTVIERIDVPLSEQTIEWTGQANGSTVPEGLYTFTVESFANGALVSSAPAQVYTRVTEARVDGGNAVLIAEGGVEVNAADVTGLREPL